ncbi:MAG: PEP-CTERM sorting domain-containing protein [Gemmatimonas sp.]
MRFSRFIPAAIAVIAALPAVSSAQVSLTNIGPKFPAALIGGGNQPFAQVGPYQTRATNPANSQAFDVFCIDADHGFKIGAYNAYVLTFDDAVSIVLQTGGFGQSNLQALTRSLGTTATYGGTNTTAADFLKDLRTESYLAGQFGPTPNASWDEIHYVIWGLFSSTQGIQPSNIAAANTLFTTAETASTAPNYNYSDWRIIIDANAWDPTFTGTLTQSVITNVVPEPGTYMLVGFGLVGLLGATRRRKRAVKQ